MRVTIAGILSAVLFSVSSAWCADVPFFSMSTARQEAVRLGDEARELATRPLDVDNGGIWGTVAATGVTAVAFIFDNDIRDRLAETKSDSLDTAAEGGSLVGHPLVHLGVAGLFYGGGVIAESPRYRDIGLMLGEAALLADVSSFVLKQAVGRARPETGRGRNSFRPFQFEDDYDSFPSMHTASSFAMASVLAGTSESLTVKVLSYSTALFVGFSRLYEDKHWASDVIMGAAVGELCGRVVMNSRVREGTGIRVAPVVSYNGFLLALISHW